MNDNKQSRKISLWCNPQMQQQLDELAEATNLDMSSIIRLAVARLHGRIVEPQETPAAAE